MPHCRNILICDTEVICGLLCRLRGIYAMEAEAYLVEA